MTYVSRRDENTYVEHGLTYYAATRAMGPTPGHTSTEDLAYPTFEPGASVPRCFRCHSTGQPKLGAGFSIEPEENGVRCEACHGPGKAHADSGGAPGTIRNPKQLNAIELNLLCGTCHRKPPEPGEEPGGRIGVGLRFDWSNSWNTRHQPVYLSQSACFRKSGGALSCLTCHDPHTPLSRAAETYDQRCAACHKSVRHQAETAAGSCVGCHMPAVRTSTPLRFRNHWIGVYASGNVLMPRPGNAPPLSLPATPAGRLVAPNDASTLRPLYEQALTQRTREHQEARGATDLGLFLKETGNWKEAIRPLRRALEINRSAGGVEVSRSEERLAQVLQSTGEVAPAAELYRRAAGSADHRIAARAWTALARLEPARAEACYGRAIQAEEAASGKDHPRVAALLSNLALVYQEKGDLRRAEELLRRALGIQDKSLGRSHYQTATTLTNLGVVLHKSGRLQEGEAAEREAISIFEQKRPQSIELAAAYGNLGKLLETKGDNVTAAGFLWKEVGVIEGVHGTDSPEVAATLTDLAMVLQKNGESLGAKSLLGRALMIYESRLGVDSPEAGRIRALIVSNR